MSSSVVRAPHPLLVLGLDGAAASVLEKLGDRLPHLTSLMTDGVSGTARSTIPPATFTAWTSLLTGAPPERHGVRDLLTRDDPDAQLRPSSGRDRLVPLLVETLALHGYSVACLGVPGLAPIPRVPGYFIAGFDAPGADRAGPESVYPPALYREVEGLGGWRYALFNEQDVDLEAATQALLDDLDHKSRILLTLKRRQHWDLFFVHLQASDTACHHLWPTWDRRSPRAEAYPASDALPRVFERLDRLVGDLLDLHTGRVLLVSDHGFGGAGRVAVHLNRALAEAGLTQFYRPSRWRRRTGQFLEVGARRLPPSWLAQATRFLPHRVFSDAVTAARQPELNRQASRVFSDELDYAPSIWLRDELSISERERLMNAIAALRHPGSGHALVQDVHQRTGEGVGPDLYLEPAWLDGYRTSFLPSPTREGPIVRELDTNELRRGRGSGMAGVHHPDGVFALASPSGFPDQPEEPLQFTLAEIGASLPHLMGVFVDGHSKSYAAPALAQSLGLAHETDLLESKKSLPVEVPRPPELDATVTARLKALGYL